MNQQRKTMENSIQMGENSFEIRLKNALSAGKSVFWEIDFAQKRLELAVDPAGYFYEFSRLLDGKLKNLLKRIHPDDLVRFEKFVSKAQKGIQFSEEIRVLWSDNRYRWLENVGSIQEENGKLTQTAILRDVTGQKEYELQQEDWKTRHELVTRAAGIIVYDYDIATGSIRWGGNIQDVLGYSSSQMGDIDQWVEFIHPEDRKRAFDLLEVAQKKLTSYEVYYRFLKSDNQYCQIYDRGTFLAKDGKAYRMLGMMSDVTEWLESKEALTRSENIFESLMNSLRVGVGLYDTEMKPTMNNEAAYKLLGLTQAQFRGMAAIDEGWNVIGIEGSDMEPGDFPIPQAIATKKPVRQVVMGVYRPKMNDRVWLMVDADPILDKDENILHVVCTYSDFTQRKHVEEALLEKNEQLVISSDLVGRKNERLLEFAQIVSHNLRSPLSSIAALTDIYAKNKKEGDAVEGNKSVEFIREVTENALQTIDGLNEVLKVQQTEQVDIQVLRFDEVLGSVLDLMSPIISEHDATILEKFEAPELSYPRIYLESILFNLLSNSIKYGDPHRSPKVTISTKASERDIIMEFSDNGVGMDLQVHGDDVFKFGKTFHENNESRGVGLYLVKNQTRTMGDLVEVESVLGKGTTFRIIFRNQNGKK